MATLIFDIKTVGEQSFHNGEEGYVRERAFSPYTAHIRSLALYDCERAQGVVYIATNTVPPSEIGDFIIKRTTEENLLRDFWEGIGGYDTLVTFNGRQFDVPFCAIRGAMYHITIPTDFMQHRYLYKQGFPRHVDLMDQLTFYGTMKMPPSLAVAAEVFSLPPPQEHQSGEVEKLLEEELLTVHVSEMITTKMLYEHWLKYLAPSSFINAIDLV